MQEIAVSYLCCDTYCRGEGDWIEGKQPEDKAQVEGPQVNYICIKGQKIPPQQILILSNDVVHTPDSSLFISSSLQASPLHALQGYMHIVQYSSTVLCPIL